MTTEQRLSVLESRCRFEMRVLVAITCATALLGLLGAKALVAPQKLQVTELEVIDEKGNTRIWFGAMEKEKFNMYGARFFNADGKIGVGILDVAQLQLERGKGRVSLMANADGAGMQLSGEGGRPRTMLYASDDHAGIQLVDTKGEVRFFQETHRIKVPGPRVEDPFAAP
jgi:hypothetical protein